MNVRHAPPADREPTEAAAAAAGKVSEALEWVERARGRLYDFHQMMGHADKLLGTAIDAIDELGETELAERLRGGLLGRDVLEGRWTYSIVEEFDDGYWQAFRAEEAHVRSQLTHGQRHVLEARMRQAEQS